jgi:hypothetical protein
MRRTLKKEFGRRLRQDENTLIRGFYLRSCQSNMVDAELLSRKISHLRHYISELRNAEDNI